MTAVIGGSIEFVAGVYASSEVQNMYAIRVDLDPRLRMNSALRNYARMEYGNEEVAWFLSAVRQPRRQIVRRSLASRLGLRRARPSFRPVAHKGTPRLSPSDLTRTA